MKLSIQQIKELVSLLKEQAIIAPDLELTPYNWVQQFGKNGIINTPIGPVKMGDHQYEKMMRKGRCTKLGMIKPTLENPFIIVEVPSGNAESDRNSSMVFIKSFINNSKERIYLFSSVTIQKGTAEVVISNEEKTEGRVARLIKEGRLAYIKTATLPSGTVPPTQGNQPAMSYGTSSFNKDTL